MSASVEMTDEEIVDLAKKMYRGDVFTSYNDGMTQDLIPLVFLPLVMLDEEAKKELIDGDIDMIYAPMRKAGPRAINGMPQFFEFSWCNRSDTKKVFKKLDEITKAVDGVIDGSCREDGTAHEIGDTRKEDG